MTDVSRLRGMLDDYSEALRTHVTVVREEFDMLERTWVALSEVYQGAGAEAFADVFQTSANRMRHYELDATALLGFLKDRVEYLRRFDAPSTEL